MQKNHGTRTDRMTGHVRQRGRLLAGMDFVGRDGLLYRIDCVSPLLESCTVYLPSTRKGDLSNPHPPPHSNTSNSSNPSPSPSSPSRPLEQKEAQQPSLPPSHTHLTSHTSPHQLTLRPHKPRRFSIRTEHRRHTANPPPAIPA